MNFKKTIYVPWDCSDSNFPTIKEAHDNEEGFVARYVLAQVYRVSQPPLLVSPIARKRKKVRK